jgi:hypothetical protein
VSEVDRMIDESRTYLKGESPVPVPTIEGFVHRVTRPLFTWRVASAIVENAAPEDRNRDPYVAGAVARRSIAERGIALVIQWYTHSLNEQICSLEEHVSQLDAHVAADHAQLKAIYTEHRPRSRGWSQSRVCGVCLTAFPCRTVRILTDPTTGGSHVEATAVVSTTSA